MRHAAVFLTVSIAASSPAVTAGDPGEPALGANTAAAIADVQRRLGAEAQVLSIEVTPGETSIAVRDREKHGHVDRHRYDAGGAAESEPLAVGRSERQLRARLFPLRDVKAEVLPGILAAAPAAVDTEGGVATHALLDRAEGSGDTGSWEPPRWRVYVEGPRGGGYAEFALDGKRKRVMRW